MPVFPVVPAMSSLSVKEIFAVFLPFHSEHEGGLGLELVQDLKSKLTTSGAGGISYFLVHSLMINV